MTWQSTLSQWSLDPSVVVGVVLAGALYWRGQRPLSIVVGGRPRSVRLWQAGAFYAGLLVIVVALESPIDYLSASLFTFHMIQHLLLIMVAAPLLVLGDPGITMLRGVPLRMRRQALGFAVRQPWIHLIGRLVAWLRRPTQTFVVFIAVLYLWHWNWLFNLTLENDTVHVLEHICFLAVALLFWSQIIEQRAVRTRLSYARRAVYIVLTGAASNVLAMYFVFAPRPLYTAYSQLPSRPFGMTTLGDQQMAGAVMWVPVLFLFAGAFAVCLYKAIGESEHEDIVPAADASYSLLPVRDSSLAGPVRSR
jgi:cytochrome c oxidase assembly factor CtaG